MKAWSIRGLFACLLLAALAGKIQASSSTPRDFHAAIIELLASRGISARQDSPVPGSALRGAVTFEMPGCGGSVQVLPIGLNLQVSPLFDTVAGEGRVRRFAYLGRTWAEPNRFELRMEWLKHKALWVLGMGRYAPDTTTLFIAEPEGCRVADSIDWGQLWYRPQPKS